MNTHHQWSLLDPQLLERARQLLRKLAGDDCERPQQTLQKGPKAAALVLAFLDDIASPDTLLNYFVSYLFDCLYSSLGKDFDITLALSDLESFASWEREQMERLNETLHKFIKTFTGGIEPLFYASDHGHMAAVKLIISTEGLKGSTQTYNKDDPQPLSLAARNGHKAIVNMLLATKGIDPNHREES
ncbi:hypothetical protein N7490_005121 [Penicillium lividum]|nr:hypothetical protein N7490_005121 [Penicillium lividum]